MSDPENAELTARQAVAIRYGSLDPEICDSIASEAFAGSAPAQYIVATAFENLGDMRQARQWFELSAVQGYAPAVVKLSGYSAA